jgi:hypothetical protein
MKLFLLAAFSLIFIVGCTAIKQPIETRTNAKYGLTGGVKDPVYPPDGPINCWVQPPHDDFWYPCQTQHEAH